MDDLADDMGLLLEQVAPDAFANLTAFSEEAKFCRIGKRPKKDCPFSGVTSVLDFCAHSHHDRNNMNGGCTVVSLSETSTEPSYGLSLDNFSYPLQLRSFIRHGQTAALRRIFAAPVSHF